MVERNPATNRDGSGACRLSAILLLRQPRILIRLAFAVVALALNCSVTQPSQAAGFTSTGSLNTGRAGNTTTLLANGKVLVTGGYDGTDRLASSELYDPATGTWSETGALSLGRSRPTAILLPNGKVLAASGSIAAGGVRTLTCELYDPAAGSWSNTGAMLAGRAGHTATLLPNGKVLVAGGDSGPNQSPLSSSELYDPSAGTWTPADPMTSVRTFHTAILLLNGKVLVAGGSSDASTAFLSSAELYDPATGIWEATGRMTSARAYHTMTLLPDGQVLIAGGQNNSATFASAELYDPATGTWKTTGAMKGSRSGHCATLLPEGKVLVAGGSDGGFTTFIVTLSSAELYDPASGKWAPTGSLNTARDSQKATLLPNGEVLISGGYDDVAAVSISDSELYDSEPSPITLLLPVKGPGGAFQFAFTGPANGTNTVVTTTNSAASLATWTVLGLAPEFSPGLYLFSDPQPASHPQRFYSVRAP
jgi:WD40 repeat protein